MALTRHLNSFASTTRRMSAGRPFQAWIGRCGTDRRVASSRHLRVWSTELRDARVSRSLTSERYLTSDLSFFPARLLWLPVGGSADSLSPQ